MTISPPTPLAESVARFDQAAAYLLDALADVAASDLDRPTPCAEWDVRAIVLHVTDVADALVDMAGTGTFDLASTSRSDGELVAAAQDRIHRLVATLDAALDRDRLEPDADRTVLGHRRGPGRRHRSHRPWMGPGHRLWVGPPDPRRSGRGAGRADRRADRRGIA